MTSSHNKGICKVYLLFFLMIVLLSGTGLADEIKPCNVLNTEHCWWVGQYEYCETVVNPAISASEVCLYQQLSGMQEEGADDLLHI